jgi:hypothetical protein
LGGRPVRHLQGDALWVGFDDVAKIVVDLDEHGRDVGILSKYTAMLKAMSASTSQMLMAARAKAVGRYAELAQDEDAEAAMPAPVPAAAPVAPAHHSPPRRKAALRVEDCGGCGKLVPWDRARHANDPRHKCTVCSHFVHSTRAICMDAGATLTSLIADDGMHFCSEVCRDRRK